MLVSGNWAAARWQPRCLQADAITWAVMRSDRESVVIVVWVVLALVFAAAAIYDAIGSGSWAFHLLILVAGELVLAGLAQTALRAVRPR